MINIGTNFLYEGPLFLDERHGIAKSKTDLLNWSIPIPAGFEVYLDLENDPAWYTYNPRLTTPYEDTGYFERRIDKGWVTNKVNEVNAGIININSQILNIWNAIENIQIQPNLTLEVISNGGVRLPGSSVVPNINWTLKNYGTPIDYSDIDDFLVDNVGYPIESPWTNNGQAINSDQTFLLTVIYNGNTIEQTVSYTFENYSWHKYFGTSSLSSITNISDVQILDSPSGWGTPTVNYEGTADCGGGKYPYYIFPESIYDSSTFKMYVGGFRTTDFEPGSLVINGENYKTIRTGYIQTGSLQIRYE